MNDNGNNWRKLFLCPQDGAHRKYKYLWYFEGWIVFTFKSKHICLLFKQTGSSENYFYAVISYSSAVFPEFGYRLSSSFILWFSTPIYINFFSQIIRPSYYRSFRILVLSSKSVSSLPTSWRATLCYTSHTCFS